MKKLKTIGYLSFGLIAVSISSTVAASALTEDTTISSEISSVISVLTTSDTVNLDLTPDADGAQTIQSDTVTVSTNDEAGYTLQLSTTTTDRNLSSATDDVTPGSGTKASPVTLAANKWGYRVDSLGGFGAGPTSSLSNGAMSARTFAGVPASTSPDTIKTTSSVATSDTTTVWYSVAADTSQPAGIYTNTVTYTALAN